MKRLMSKVQKEIKPEGVIIALVMFIATSVVFFCVPIKLDLMTKSTLIGFNALGLTIPAFITIRMQLLQTKKLGREMEEMIKKKLLTL